MSALSEAQDSHEEARKHLERCEKAVLDAKAELAICQRELEAEERGYISAHHPDELAEWDREHGW